MIKVFRLPRIDSFIDDIGIRLFSSTIDSFGILRVNLDVFIFFENIPKPTGVVFSKTERPMFTKLADPVDIIFFHKMLLYAKSMAAMGKGVRLYTSHKFIDNVMGFISSDKSVVVSIKDCFNYLIKIIDGDKNLQDFKE